MIYVYDVLVNLSEEVYDFYDWDESDKFSHVRRVPIYKIKEKDYFDFASKKIKLDEEVLNSIKDKTQVFSSRNIEVIPYSSIFTDGKNAIMILFNSSGSSIKKSKFLVNEELEILDITKSMKTTDISYKVLNNKCNRNDLLRSEKKVINNILEELKLLKDSDEKLEYLYYEWFNKSDGVNKYDVLVKSIKSKFTNRHFEFLELLNLLTIKK